MIKKRTIRADQMISGMLIELDDDIPEMVKDVEKTASKICFRIGNEPFCVDHDAEITQVIRLTLLCGD